jgi:hypothetical protein
MLIPTLSFYPSWAKMLVMVCLSPLIDFCIYILLEVTFVRPVAPWLAILPTLVIIIRWLIRRPTLMLDSEGITICTFSLRNRVILWKDITMISRTVYAGSGSNAVYLQIWTKNTATTFWGRLQRNLAQRKLVPELLLPFPVMTIIQQIADTYVAADMPHRITFSPSIPQLRSYGGTHTHEATHAHPWTWSREAVIAGGRFGVLVGFIAGIVLAIAMLFIPTKTPISQAHTPLLANITAWGIVIGAILIWPGVAGIWLTRRARGNKVPALVASISAIVVISVCVALIDGLSVGPSVGAYVIIDIVMIPGALFFMSLATSSSWAQPKRSSRHRR